MVVSKLFYAPLKNANIPLVSDSSSFASVLAAANAQYGDTYEVNKKDCIGSVQKQLGTALRSYRNKQRNAVLSHDKGTGGKVRLTDPIIDCMQTTYGYAIRKNKGDQASSIAAI